MNQVASGPVSKTTLRGSSAACEPPAQIIAGSEGHFPRHILLPSSRIERAVSFNETSSPMYWPMLNLHLLLRTRPFRITLWIIPEKKHFDAMTKRGVTERLPHVLRPLQPLAERHSREHKPTPSKMVAPQTRHPPMHRSRYEGDL